MFVQMFSADRLAILNRVFAPFRFEVFEVNFNGLNHAPC